MRLLSLHQCDSAVVIRRGERIGLEVPSMTAAGYRWVAEVDGDAISVARSDELDRAAGAEVWVITARDCGRGRVTLHQRRPWSSGPPTSDYIVHVRVTP